MTERRKETGALALSLTLTLGVLNRGWPRTQRKRRTRVLSLSLSLAALQTDISGGHVPPSRPVSRNAILCTYSRPKARRRWRRLPPGDTVLICLVRCAAQILRV